ncbi:MAG: SsrA-binding protein SmpB [Ignavibacteriales bacterium]|nr:SsrA-binding protein SmpB [Ignavibacteriales bacterium]
MKNNPGEKTITVNRKARHEYIILQSYEAGIALVGTEVKSIRQNKISISDGYAFVKDSEVWLKNININVYTQGNINNHDPLRDRRLLLNKREIRKISKSILEKGCTIIPLRVYIKNGIVKIEIGLARGKKFFDKREAIAKRDAERELERKIKR